MYVIVRTENAGCFAGTTTDNLADSLDPYNRIVLGDARRLWYWAGAASLSQLAAVGSSRPDACKFAAPVTVLLTEVIEVIEMTDVAWKALEQVPVWTA